MGTIRNKNSAELDNGIILRSTPRQLAAYS